MEWLAALVVGLMWVLGLVGLVIPVLPGPTLIMASAWVCKLLVPDSMDWSWVFWVTGIWFFASLVDFFASVIGAKAMGSSQWGLFGAMAGAFVGLFFLPFGLILGPLLGAFFAELLVARRSPVSSSKASVGAGLGLVIGKLVQVFASLGMMAVMAWAVVGVRLLNFSGQNPT